MEKVMVVGYTTDDEGPAAVDDIGERNEHLLVSLDEQVYPGVALQVEDRDATERWQRRSQALARRVVGSLAVWAEDGDNVTPIIAIVRQWWPEHTVCVVTETVPRWRIDHATSAREPRPGVIVTSLLYRRPDTTPVEFAAHWRNVHQPMSLRIHPQHTYVRNLVTRAVTAEAPGFDAICEEGFASVDDVLDPSRFFGADSSRPWMDNARTIGDDVPLFLDTDHTVATIMREYRLREFR